jgi:hypothetical protein
MANGYSPQLFTQLSTHRMTEQAVIQAFSPGIFLFIELLYTPSVDLNIIGSESTSGRKCFRLQRRMRACARTDAD